MQILPFLIHQKHTCADFGQGPPQILYVAVLAESHRRSLMVASIGQSLLLKHWPTATKAISMWPVGASVLLMHLQTIRLEGVHILRQQPQ